MRSTEDTHSSQSSLAWRYPAALFFSQRALLSLLGVALFLAGMAPRTEDPILRPYFGVEPIVSGSSGALLGVWQRFDAIHFLRIAETGYSSADLSPFYPAFPLLSRWVGLLSGGNILLGSFLVANLAMLLALFALYLWMLAEGHDRKHARQMLLYLVWFPTAFFLFVPYSESLFLLFVILGMWAARRQRWLIAGSLAALASLTRISGIVLSAVILVEWFSSRKAATWRLSLKAWSGALMPVAALAGFEFWRVAQGLPGTLDVQLQYWHRIPSYPWEGIRLTFTRLVDRTALPIEMLDLVVVLGMVVAGFLMIKKLPASFSVYHWGLLLFNLSQLRLGQPLSGQARYAAVLFPAFIVLAMYAKGALASRAVAYSFLVLNIFLAGQFIIWGWVG